MGRSILLAVSSGIDSMYMAERSGELFSGCPAAVAHCNFALRGEESDGDEAFLEDWCSKRGLRLYRIRFDTTAYGRAKGVSVEMAARELRYSWFAKLCNEEGFDAVAVAHNADDNAETMLLNLLRGCGTRGLRGMAAESQLPGAPGKLLLRPLLGVSREEISSWMAAHGCEWREDSTNSGTLYKRNKLRHLVMPVFKEINPSYLRTLGRDMAHIAQENDICESYYGSLGLGSLESGVSVRRILSCKHWEWVLYRLTEGYGLSEETLGKLTELLGSGRTISGKVFQAPGWEIRIKGKTIFATKKQ